MSNIIAKTPPNFENISMSHRRNGFPLISVSLLSVGQLHQEHPVTRPQGKATIHYIGLQLNTAYKSSLWQAALNFSVPFAPFCNCIYYPRILSGILVILGQA
jgi:hypothetical protein